MMIIRLFSYTARISFYLLYSFVMENQVTIESEKNLYLFNKETNEYYILNGDLNYEGESDNASLSLDFKEYIDLDVKQIPPKVDLRPWMTTVENQKKLKTW